MTYRGMALAALLVALPSGAAAQGVTSVRSAVLYESYDFGGGIFVDKVSELTIPVVVNLQLARNIAMTLSGGFASVNLTSSDPEELPNQSLSGPLDTELRLSLNVVPRRLVVLATGAVPTGNKSVAREELAILGVLSSDVIGFSAANLGAGGNFGGGLVGAIPIGRWALGYGGTFRQPMEYQPIRGIADTTLSPGSEFKLRAGLEGPVARRTYFRFAGIYAARQKDKVSGATRNGIGNRLIGYLSINHGIGGRGSSITLYAFDVFRGDPQIEPTAVGAAVFPRGNLVAAGVRVALGGRSMTVTPRVEYRISAQAADTSDTTLRRAGLSWRFGVDVRRRLTSRASAVIQLGGITGNVVQSGTNIGLSGFRVGAHLEYRP
ncbi:MAG: hypothetical protein ACE5PT_09450 [Gemmatimonadales bacterium]